MKAALGISALVLIFLSSTQSIACESSKKALPYYGQKFHQMMKNKDFTGLRSALHQVLNDFHTPDGEFDAISTSCKSNSCYKHVKTDYKTARKMLFGSLHLNETKTGYSVKDVYCEKTFTDKDFDSDAETRGIGPFKIPNSNILNTEHTWPQSKFSRRYQKNMQKTDLHGLYPTVSKANSVRSNHQFRNVKGSKGPCGNSFSGRSEFNENGTFFEPPNDHKGNVARSLFYFAVRYEMKISKLEEQTIREWHKLDPVDEFERERNEGIFEFQNNRNPFIDYPELVSQIEDF